MEFTVKTIKGNEPKCPACGAVNELYSTAIAKVTLRVQCAGQKLVISRKVLESELRSVTTLEYDVGEVICGACGTVFSYRPWITDRVLANEQ